MATNDVPVIPGKHDRLLTMIHPDLRWKFKNFTTEELFYAIQLLGGKGVGKRGILASLQCKLVLYLRDETSDRNPISLTGKQSKDQLTYARLKWGEYYAIFLSLPEKPSTESLETLRARFRSTG